MDFLKFLKLELADEDNQVVTRHEAESFDALLDEEVAEYQQDDRLSPCHDLQTAECVTRDGNRVMWAPGDGGQYTIAVYALDSQEGREQLQEWLDEPLIFPEQSHEE